MPGVSTTDYPEGGDGGQQIIVILSSLKHILRVDEIPSKEQSDPWARLKNGMRECIGTDITLYCVAHSLV